MKIIKQYLGLQKEVYVICICKIIDHLGSLIGPMFTLILSAKLGFDAATIAKWALIYSFITFPINILGGRLADKVNKKLLINICDILSSAVFIACGFFPLTKTTIICYLFGCLLQTAESPAYSVFIADITAAKDRDRAHSLSYLCSNLGLILAPVIGGLLLENHANLIFIISGVMQFISIIVFDIFIRETGTRADKQNVYETVTEKKSFFAVLFENPSVFLFALILGVSFLTYNQFTYILPLDFKAVFADNGSVLYGTVSSVNCITVLVATSLVTSLISRFDSIRKMILGELCEMAGLAVLAFCLRIVPLCYIGAVVFTLGEIMCTITTAPYFLNRVPANYRGRISAFSDTFASLCVAVGNLGIGKLYDTSGSQITWGVILLVYLLIALSFAVIRKLDIKKYPGLYKK